MSMKNLKREKQRNIFFSLGARFVDERDDQGEAFLYTLARIIATPSNPAFLRYSSANNANKLSMRFGVLYTDQAGRIKT